VPYLNFKGVTNDYVALLSITARYKLNATKKTHLRNINIYDFIDKSDLLINASDSCKACDAIELAKANAIAIDSLKYTNKLLKLQLDTVMTLLSNYSVDTDGDGVTDFMDRCPATPAKVRGLVDRRGCPLDSDLDAIPDYLDNCPTIPGVPSNQGCPEIKQEVKALFKQALQGIQFETNKADIKPESSVILDKIVDILVQNSDYLIEIQGHTDNVGKSMANLILSDNRAQAVLKYLTDKGLNKERFTARGFGDTKPVVSNKTEQGKAENRRVEFVVRFKK
jgi:outer membrane protein OmpA-like peptidoglycan-associated protein